LQDADTMWLNAAAGFYPPIHHSIEELIQLSRVIAYKKLRARHKEERIVVVGGIINDYTKDIIDEPDGDIHLILHKRNSKKSIIAEVPHPDSLRSLKYAKIFRDVRTWIEDSLRHRKVKNRAIMISGVIFFDKNHRQNGRARNGVEIHPIIGIRFAKN
jgi:hypothetical protein